MANKEVTVRSIWGHLVTLVSVSGTLIYALCCGPFSYEVYSLWSKNGGMYDLSCMT